MPVLPASSAPRPETAATCLRAANCDACPLAAYWEAHGRGRKAPEKTGPVSAEFQPGEPGKAKILLVARSPGADEVERGRPACGSWGASLLDLLGAAGLSRTSVSWTHAVACRFPADDRVKFEAWRRKQNAQRKKQGIAPFPTAEEACRPRLLQEMDQHDAVLGVGGDVLRAVGVDAALRVAAPTMDDFAGFPTRTRIGGVSGPKPLLVTDMDWANRGAVEPLVISDIRKALAIWWKGSEWVDPPTVVKPTPEEFAAAMVRAVEAGLLIACDVETRAYRKGAYVPEEFLLPGGAEPLPEQVAHYDAQHDFLRCIQFYIPAHEEHPEVCYILPWEAVDGSQTYRRENGSVWFEGYTEAEKARLSDTVRWVMGAASLVGHNFRVYDRMVIERVFGVVPANVYDTHPGHKLAESDLRHGLLTCGRTWTLAPPWKAEHAATEARSDEELVRYGGRDVKVNWLIKRFIERRVESKAQSHLMPVYARLQDVAVSMHKMGLRFSERRRQEHVVRVDREITAAQQDLAQVAPMLVGVERFNPNSTAQLRRILFDSFDLEPKSFTDSGDPSTNDTDLRALLFDPATPKDAQTFLKSLRRYRRFVKIKGTYLDAWDPRYGLAQRFDPVGDPDGWYLHADYNACGTIGWRFSSSNPNAQNISGVYLTDKANGAKVEWSLRDIFEAAPGYCFIGADMDQLELRFAAALAQCTPLLDAIMKGEIDTHNLSGQVVYGDDYWKLDGAPKDPREKGKGLFKRTRDLIKRFVYAVLYEAMVPTIRELIAETEDADGNYPFAAISERTIRDLRNKWLAGFPEFVRWWKDTKDTARRQGYLAEPVWGLRRYFYGSSSPNEIINFRVQAGGGAVVHQAMFNVLEFLPFDLSARTGLVQQVHDSLMFQVPGNATDASVQALSRQITEAMTIRVPGLPVTFTAEAKAGKRWSDT